MRTEGTEETGTSTAEAAAAAAATVKVLDKTFLLGICKFTSDSKLKLGRSEKKKKKWREKISDFVFDS